MWRAGRNPAPMTTNYAEFSHTLRLVTKVALPA
jgi:hypothetical protein